MLPVCGAEIANEMSYRLGLRVVPAPYALPAGFAMFLAVGTVAAALHGRLTATIIKSNWSTLFSGNAFIKISKQI